MPKKRENPNRNHQLTDSWWPATEFSDKMAVSQTETEAVAVNLGENIKTRRQELKLSQEYVAEQLGVSRQAVSKWETGQSEPTASNLIRLAEVFETSLSELTGTGRSGAASSETEKGRDGKKPNPILRANLIKLAIILQIGFGRSSAVFLHQLREDRSYLGQAIFSIIMLAVCSTWMASNHRFEPDMARRRRNLNIELCYCLLQMTVALFDIFFGPSVITILLYIVIGAVYLLYINPKFMNRKLTK